MSPQETLNLSTCAKNSTDKKKKKKRKKKKKLNYVSPTPTATATHTSLANFPTMHSRLFHQDWIYKQQQKSKPKKSLKSLKKKKGP